MQNTQLKNIVDATFRANPDYNLVVFDRLPPEQRVALGDLLKDPDFYGILHPRERSGWGIKTACRDTALLFMTLREPGSLPSYVRSMFGDQANREIAQLVLDGVLQLEVNDAFACGANAYPLIYGADLVIEPPQGDAGVLSHLSINALKYAQALPIDDAIQLSSRLYFYNRIPASPRWKRTFQSPQSVLEQIGAGHNGSNKAILDKYWAQSTPSPYNDAWLVWSSRQPKTAAKQPRVMAEATAKSSTGAVGAVGAAKVPTQTYKLYVSPQPGALRDAFGPTLATFTESRVPHFKMGKDASGLLRPDKLIAYFEEMGHLQEVAEQLERRLAGVPAHGVPFTAELSGDGLLSWGIDPPAEKGAISWQGRESWRFWVTNRLATALLSARASQTSGVEPWRFALTRLGLEGIDVDTWAPSDMIWQDV